MKQEEIEELVKISLELNQSLTFKYMWQLVKGLITGEEYLFKLGDLILDEGNRKNGGDTGRHLVLAAKAFDTYFNRRAQCGHLRWGVGGRCMYKPCPNYVGARHWMRPF